MLKIPKPIPILFIKDKFSLNNKIPTKITIIRFKIVNTEIAFDKNSYFKEIAPKKLSIK